MKKILLPFLFLLCIQLSAQSLVLTQAANEPIIGDDDMRYYLDTSAYTSGLPTSITGSTAVWNFTNLQAQNPVLITQYLSPSTNTASAGFPGCTFVEDDVFFTLFLKSTTTPTPQTELVGLASSTIAISLTNSAIIAKYPISFGTTQTDAISGTYTAMGYNGPCSGNITTNANAAGTLNLPGGVTFTNVLRVKSVQSISLNQGFITVGTAKQTIYNFYHGSQKFPVLSINYLSFSLITSQTPTVTGYVSGISNAFTVGMKENSLSASDLSVFPNPVGNTLQLAVKGQLQASEIKLYSQLGQLVYQNAYAGELDLSHLQSGIYTIEVKTDKGIIRKKLVKD